MSWFVLVFFLVIWVPEIEHPLPVCPFYTLIWALTWTEYCLCGLFFCFFFPSPCVVHASCSNSHQRKVNDQSTHLYTWPYFTLVLNTPRPETTVKFTTAASVCLKNNLWRCGCSKNAAMNQVCLWNCRNVGRPANSGFHFFLAVSLMAMDIFMSLTLWTCTLCSFIHCIFVHVHTAHAFITLHLTLALLLISCT